jgi:hypothetical protein
MLWLSAAQKALLDADSSVVMMKSISDSSRTFAVEGEGGWCGRNVMVRRYGTAEYAEKLPVELFFGPAKRIRRWSDVELHGFCWPENLICISSDFVFVVVIALSGWKFGSSGLVLKLEVDVDLKAGSRKSEDSKSRSKLSFQSNFSPLHRALNSAHS